MRRPASSLPGQPIFVVASIEETTDSALYAHDHWMHTDDGKAGHRKQCKGCRNTGFAPGA
jgi:hypothetical protein